MGVRTQQSGTVDKTIMAHKASSKALISLGRVLVLEDDAVLALAIEDALLDGGAREVVTFSRADKALADMQSTRPDVIILDVHIADSDDGWAMAELATMLGPRPPRIIFSTGAPQEIPDHIAAMGMVLEKPYEPARLIEALQSNSRKGLFARLRKPKG
ncbi:response regulator [Altererythrobacter sp. ZODW24]|uniref:response regulator n=1 Tax=Altererythrobacter sp. ZODW24 TaxID=2185142 RepID=UPI001F07862B|nr:response regulator [Altererythrobacter sp. ZODW24]